MASPIVKAMFCAWSPWARSQGLAVGKRERDALSGPGTPHEQVSQPSASNVVVAAVHQSAVVLKGRISDTEMDILYC